MGQLTGLLGGYNEQRESNTNYLAQIDQMKRAAISQQMEQQRIAQQAQQFGQSNILQQQQLAQTGALRGAEMAQAAQVHKDLLAHQAQQFGLQSGQQDFTQGTQRALQQRQDQARNALSQLLSGTDGTDIATSDLARAILPYDVAQGASLLKSAKEEQIQEGLLSRTGGTGVMPQAGYRWNPQTGGQEFIPGGPADPDTVATLSESKRQANEKALPTSAAQKLIENNQNLRRAEQALALVQGKNVDSMTGDKAATGLKGYLPDVLLNRIDPSGLDARAAIADLGSLVVHDRSGAAVTASEIPRLKPFIPSEKDNQATIEKKLSRFAAVYRDIVGETTDFYKESGYKVPSEVLRHANITGSDAQPNGGSKAGTTFSSLPDPRQYVGKTVRNPETGMRMTSTGTDWVKAQ